jgi:hypothetical protein
MAAMVSSAVWRWYDLRLLTEGALRADVPVLLRRN